jgi:hypothetical protein
MCLTVRRVYASHGERDTFETRRTCLAVRHLLRASRPAAGPLARGAAGAVPPVAAAFILIIGGGCTFNVCYYPYRRNAGAFAGYVNLFRQIFWSLYVVR